MKYADTALPDNALFHDAFDAGFAAFIVRARGDNKRARQKYMKGPLAAARLVHDICENFDGKDLVVAACLSGPEIFARSPSDWAHDGLIEFAKKIRSIAFVPQGMIYRAIETLSDDGKLFFQMTSILMMEQMTDVSSVQNYTLDEQNSIYKDAVEIYSAARGITDRFALDTRFEIAAMNMTMMMNNTSFLWTRAGQSKPMAQSRH